MFNASWSPTIEWVDETETGKNCPPTDKRQVPQLQTKKKSKGNLKGRKDDRFQGVRKSMGGL